MKKGFTLVELLAVVVILSILSIIVTPVILQVVENASKKSFQTTAYSIVNSMNLYYTEVMENTGEKLFEFPQKEGEKLKLDGQQPKGGKVHVNDDGDIAIAVYNQKWCAIKKYEEKEVVVIRLKATQCNLPIDGETPVLTLNPPTVMTLPLGKKYEEPGFTLKTLNGKELDPNYVEIKGTVNANVIGEYELTYTATYKNKVNEKIRKVMVIDMTPIITIEPIEQTKFVKSQTIKVTVEPIGDNIIESFSYTLIQNQNPIQTTSVNGTETEIVLDTDGIYQIIVTTEDNQANQAQKESNLYKIDTIPPELTIPQDGEVSKNKVADFQLMEGVSATDNSGVTPIITTQGNLDAVPGVYEITYTAQDEAGNTTTKVRNITVTKGEAPILNIYPNGTSDWVNESKPILIATDDEQIKTFSYRIEKDGVLGNTITVNTTNQNSEQTEITLDQNGVYRIIGVVTDDEDLETTFTSEPFYIDSTPPTIVFKVSGTPFNANNWSKQNVTVNVQINDDHIPKSFQYCTTTSTTCTPTTKVDSSTKDITVTSESASNKICVIADDLAGNRSTTTCSPNYAIDKTAPSAPTISKNVEKVTITAGKDTLSGVDKTTYLLSGATTKGETNYTTAITVTNAGTTNVSAYTYDLAGNKSTQASISGNNGVIVTAASCYDQNMISFDGYCQKIVAATKTEVCTVGGSVVNGRCKYAALKNVRYEHTCPSGYYLSSGSSNTITGTCTGTATKYCVLGTLKGNQCVWDIGIGTPTYSPPSYKCSGGGLANGSVCTVQATTRDASTYTCYLGGTLSGQNCDTGTPLVLYNCEEGEYNDPSLQTCLVKTSACPTGSTYASATGKCYQ